ncbi:MAG TPA: hypothetical protein PLF81_29410 [Candidatus Anammoximicrobium sp.]|nr:hypothetical protein [Candidatus Anammoximicrobium sp.]
MNYYAHARPFLDNPYFAAGTAVPDWLSVLDRKMRVSSKAAQTLAAHADGRVASLAAGIVQHHHDDGWFHQTRAFAELSLQLTAAVRQVLPQDDGFRPSFLGHILVEILLDASLIAAAPAQLDAYYEALNRVDPQLIGDAINQVATRPSGLWPVFIPQFRAERFLYDYLEDAKLLARLNRVMRRVQLQPLPDEFLNILPAARQAVGQRREELLNAP